MRNCSPKKTFTSSPTLNTKNLYQNFFFFRLPKEPFGLSLWNFLKDALQTF